MALGDPYVTVAQAKVRLGIPASDTDDDVRVGTAVATASGQIEDYCKRQFNDSGSASVRYFQSNSYRRAVIDDFSTVTGLVVEVGSFSGGFGQTLVLDEDYFVGPVNRSRNEADDGAYWRLRTLNGLRFPRRYREEPNLKVTARWGWSSVPPGVVEACYLLTARLFRRNDSPDGVIGGFEGTPLRVGYLFDPDAERSLKNLRKHRTGEF